MSIPRDLLDQLLSGYVDETLSADERRRVDQLLQTDDEFAQELAELHEIRGSLKEIAKADADVRLTDGFAERVLDSAVARARSEGLNDEHPLIRLAEQPTVAKSKTPKPPSSGGGFPWGQASLLVGLAASIVIAVIVLRPSGGEPIARDGVDTNADLVAIDTPADRASGAVANETAEATKPGIGTTEPGITEFAANSAADRLDPSPLDGTTERTDEARDLGEPATPRQDTIASDTAAMSEREQVPGEPPADPELRSVAPATQVGFILVFDVRQTASGQASGAVDDAMRYASLEPARQQPVTDEIVGVVEDQLESGNELNPASVLYLQAPARSLDRFFLRLMSDEDGIQSVGMALAANATILRLADSVAADPTSVRHGDVSLELSGGHPAMVTVMGQLGRLTYAPLSGDVPSAVSSSSGPDVMAQVLVVVRPSTED